MALSRPFKDAVVARAQSDSSYRNRMLQAAVQNLVAGELETGKSLLQLYINATVGFQELGNAMDMAPQSLTRMLGSDGNPRANNLCTMLAFLQEEAGIKLTVEVLDGAKAGEIAVGGEPASEEDLASEAVAAQPNGKAG
jgi:hypothetical protein